MRIYKKSNLVKLTKSELLEKVDIIKTSSELSRLEIEANILLLESLIYPTGQEKALEMIEEGKADPIKED
ncbi:MAG: hypothetical protein JJV88_05130 [Sulfurovum sp.]|nr:hypothetical protein [Sulfurovaceae bacterium]